MVARRGKPLSRQEARAASPPSPAAQSGPARRALFAAVTALSPFLLFGLVEGGLRLARAGPDLSLFRTEVVGGRSFLVMNPEVKGRYFSAVEFSPNTSPDLFPLEKAPGTFRIFCLGGSTTVGFPYGYVGSFSTALRDRLRRLFPDRSIEVVNLGMTATNSTTALDIAGEILDYAPDLVIVYDGHNEFYGALGVASHETPMASRWITRAYLHALRLRTFVALRDLYNRLRGFSAPPADRAAGGTMMERLARGRTVPLASETYRAALRIFEANVADLVATLTGHGVPVILSTQVSNLRDQPPFVSEAEPLPPPSLRADYHLRFNEGLAAWMDGRVDSALAAFRGAARVDSLRAEVHYQTGRCLDSLGRRPAARAAYTRARDLDLLRFRASSDFNAVIRRAGGGHPLALVADIEGVFAAASPDSLIGNSLVLEHLHPNARGYSLIAAEYARLMRRQGLLAPPAEWELRDTIAEERHRAASPLTDLDERLAARRIAALTSGWPFRPVEIPLRPVAPDDTLGAIVESVARADRTWEEGHVAAALYYERRGELGRAAREYSTLINQIPQNASPYLALGRLEAARGRADTARVVFEASLRVERTFAALMALGTIALNAGRPEEAIDRLANARALATSAPDDAESGYLLALAQVRARRHAEARTLVEALLRRHPDHRPTRELLAFLDRKSSP